LSWALEHSVLPFGLKNKKIIYRKLNIFFTFKAEHRLRVFQNLVLREIFGADRVEVTWEWRRLLDVECHDVYCGI